jgi:cyclic beta-1,2-glucan synthetase
MTRETKDARKLPEIVSGSGEQTPRAYAIAKSYLQAVDFEFTKDSLSIYLEAMHQKLMLRMDEFYAVKPMLQLTLLERIAAFADSLQDGSELARWINSLREIGEEEWKDLFEKLSPLEQILREDPAGAYANMDFESRNLYRLRVADLAAHSGMEETEIARRASPCLVLAAIHSDQQVTERRSHAGYHQFESGKKLLETINYRPSNQMAETSFWPVLSWWNLFATAVVMWFC